MVEKIKVNYAFKGELDFGLFPDKHAKGNIKVNKSFWEKYVNKRLEFEQMHHELSLKIGFQKRENIHKLLNDALSKNKVVKK